MLVKGNDSFVAMVENDTLRYKPIRVQPADGYFTMPETPGLGFEPDRDAIREIAKLPLSQGRGKG